MKNLMKLFAAVAMTATLAACGKGDEPGGGNNNDRVAVTGVSLDNTTLTLDVDDTATLTATVTPADATDKTVAWKSSNTAVATVDEAGVVTAIKVGKATITATTANGKKTASCAVTVEVADYGTVVGQGTKDQVTWQLTDRGVLVISGKGEVHGIDWSPYSDHIKTVVIKNGVTSIGFSDSPALTSITIPNSVTYISFYDCPGLTSITIPNSVTSLIVQKCPGLTSITIPDSVTNIGYRSAFEDCTGLTSVTIGNGVTYIGDSAFSGCTGLESVTIGNGVTDIGYYAFSSCTSLVDVTIGNGVEIIDYAFDNCPALKNVAIMATTPPSLRHGLGIDGGTLWVPKGFSNIYKANSLWAKPFSTISELNDNPYSVTEVTLNKTTLPLYANYTQRLIATVEPFLATNKNATWKSSDPSVATVDANGNVTSVKIGTTIVTVTTADGGKTATCTVTVEAKDPSGLSVLINGVRWAKRNVGTTAGTFADSQAAVGGYFANPTTVCPAGWRLPNGADLRSIAYCTWYWWDSSGPDGAGMDLMETNTPEDPLTPYIFIAAGGHFGPEYVVGPPEYSVERLYDYGRRVQIPVSLSTGLAILTLQGTGEYWSYAAFLPWNRYNVRCVHE